MITKILLMIFGLASGLAVSGGVIALIVSLRLLPRLSTFTNTAAHTFIYESSLLLGAACGNLLSIFSLSFSSWLAPLVSSIFLLCFSLLAGAFVGALSVALAETLNILPIFMRRTHLLRGTGTILIALALGKCIGTLAQFYLGWVPQK